MLFRSGKIELEKTRGRENEKGKRKEKCKRLNDVMKQMHVCRKETNAT